MAKGSQQVFEGSLSALSKGIKNYLPMKMKDFVLLEYSLIHRYNIP